MDPITQGALGAIAATSIASPKNIRIAAIIGAVGGMLADADVFIRSDNDPLLTIEYHRHFTHSLLFIPLGGLITALLLFLGFRKKISFQKLFIFATAGYATAGLLDACTSYGTQLLWPITDTRFSWNIISVVDPIFTCTLLVFLSYALWRRSPLAPYFAFVFGLCYLTFGVFQNQRANIELEKLATERGHLNASRFTVKPTLGNLSLWRGIYEYNNHIYADAIYIDYLQQKTKIYQGSNLAKVSVETIAPTFPPESPVQIDLERFQTFSDDYLIIHPEQPEILGDARYSMLPDSLSPLWGIKIDTQSPLQHADFQNFRKRDKKTINRFKKMIFGQAVSPIEK